MLPPRRRAPMRAPAPGVPGGRAPEADPWGPELHAVLRAPTSGAGVPHRVRHLALFLKLFDGGPVPALYWAWPRTDGARRPRWSPGIPDACSSSSWSRSCRASGPPAYSAGLRPGGCGAPP